MKRLTILLLILMGCTTGKQATVEINKDEFSGKKSVSLNNNQVESSVNILDFGVVCTEAPSIDTLQTIQFIEIEYRAKDWLFIKSGQSLKFRMYGKKYSLSAPDYMIDRETTGGSWIKERVGYPVSDSTLNKMANADSLKGRVYGDEYVDFHFNHKNFKNLRSYIAKRDSVFK